MRVLYSKIVEGEHAVEGLAFVVDLCVRRELSVLLSHCLSACLPPLSRGTAHQVAEGIANIPRTSR